LNKLIVFEILLELFFTGNFFYGDYYHYNEGWKIEFEREHPEAEILYLNFESLKADLKSNIKIIADFLNISEYILDEGQSQTNILELLLKPTFFCKLHNFMSLFYVFRK
jgi:hypothetical protein